MDTHALPFQSGSRKRRINRRSHLSTSERELFKAVKGEGAYLNQKKIHVSAIEKLATSLLATGFPSVKRAQNPNIHYYWDFTLRSHGIRRDGSAALDSRRWLAADSKDFGSSLAFVDTLRASCWFMRLAAS